MRLAHKAAIESDRVPADCVEATEFPQLVMRHEVRGVPRTVVNDSQLHRRRSARAQLRPAVMQAVAQSGAPRSLARSD